ncbi:MAG: CCA tRNA nucleotidyltransferase [Magnetococcales bacterium]|nr:CCA tRNA nucleotidyltransferase [Magnetococcales bacterium]
MHPVLKSGFPPFIAGLLDQLNHLIGPIHLVGSAVRNVLQGCPLSNDLNILTPRPLEQCLEALRQAGQDAVGGGTGDKSVFVPLKGWEKPKTIEISKYRHRPAQTPTIEEDLLHRDVTVNAMAYAWPDGPLIDPFHGREDLAVGRIRLVNGEETLNGDPLRAVRLFRFSLQLSAVPDEEDLRYCTRISLDQVPPERIRVELDRIFSFTLEAPHSRTLLQALFDSDLGAAMLPELQVLRQLPATGPFEGMTVWQHSIRTLLSLSHSPRDEDISLLDLRWTVLLAGLIFHARNLRTLKQMEERGCHEKAINQIHLILARYGFSKRRQKKIINILVNLSLGFPFSDRVLKRLLKESVPIEGLIALVHHWNHSPDDLPSGQGPSHDTDYAKALERCRTLRKSGIALNSLDLAMSGGDIRDIVRRPPGPWLGHLQGQLLQWVAEDFSRNNRDTLRRKVLEWIALQDKV